MLRNAGFWTSLAVLLLAQTLLVLEPQSMVGLRNLAFDSFQRWRPREYRDARVRVVDIDNASLARLGQWPWPRSRHAALVRRLTDAGASVIAFDFIFSEPDMQSPAVALRRWADRPEIAGLMRDLPDDDALFAEVIAEAPVVLAFSLTAESTGERLGAKAGFAELGGSPRAYLPSYQGVVAPLRPLLEATAGLGSVNFTGDATGVIRRVPAILRLESQLLPALWLEALRLKAGQKNYLVRASNADGEGRFGNRVGILSVNLARLEVPTDPSGHLWLHYTRSVPERYVPAWEVLSGQFAPGTFEDSIVFIGTSATGLKDIRYTPFGVMPGVEVHAQAAEQTLQGTYLTRPDWARAAEALFLFAIWLVLMLLLTRLGALWSALIGLAAVVAAAGASWHAFAEYRLMIDPLFPSLTALTLYLASSLPRHMQTERQQRWIRRAFSSYISPNLVQHLIDHPEAMSLGGERRECSFVMTDLAGFTALVERADPTRVVTMLNSYLDGMVALALKHEGTLDRIIGDAVAVMFSAPVAQPDHAERAVACALDMDDFARRFAAEQSAAGMTVRGTRIGVNTGPVIVGNVGGETLVDYRALGDAVNTASRLESVNRQLGTNICVSGATVARCPSFAGRPIGALLLAGKSEAVETFEPLPAERLADPAVQRYLEAYRMMAAGAPEAAAAFSALAAEAPNDPLVRLHHARLAAGESGATIIFESK